MFSVALCRQNGTGLGFHMSGIACPFTVTSVVDGGPAAVAGMSVGDNILQVNGSSVQSHASAVKEIKTAETVNLVLTRYERGSDSATQLAKHHDLVRRFSLMAKEGSSDMAAVLEEIAEAEAAKEAMESDGDNNQDRYHHETLCAPDGTAVELLAVFDGHGLLGEVAAQRAVDVLGRQAAALDLAAVRADPEPALGGLFEAMHRAVLETHASPPAEYEYTSGSTTLTFRLDTSGRGGPALGDMYVVPDMDYIPPRPIDFGCTAVVALVFPDAVVVANSGDASAIVCSQNVPGCEDRDGFRVEVPCVKHTASEPTEIERVERDFPGCAYFTPDGYMAPLDPDLAQYEVQLTRSLGHNLLRAAGISAAPDVHVLPYDPGQGHSLVLCSDGVTDEISPEGFMDRLQQCVTAKEASKTLCTEAQDFCMDPDKVDDCTALVLYFRSS